MKYTFCALILSLSFLLANAQKQLPTVKKVSFGQDGKMYVNKDLGVYLWLSTSQNTDAPKHLLQSETTEEYSNPMFLDTEGYNTLRSPSAVDTSTRKTIYPLQDIIFEVYADGQAPTSKLKKVKGKTQYKAGKLYGCTSLKYIVSSYDRMSGVESTYYSINGSDYTIITDTISLTKEGENILKIYSTDKVGNREEPVELKLIIDKNKP